MHCIISIFAFTIIFDIQMKILVIGGGNMGKTFAQSFLQSGMIAQNDLFIFEKDDEKVQELNAQSIGTAFNDNQLYFEQADIFVLAVKPQDASTIYSLLKNHIKKNTLVISIMAGIKISDIKSATGAKKIVRAMPNLPCLVGKGTTGYKLSSDILEEDKSYIHQLLSTTGIALEISDEEKIDAITAISGSGPAYVFYFMESMIQASMQFGFSREEATQLVTQTFEGSISLFKENDISCQEWIQKVSSKGGTTEAAIQTFNQYDVKNHIGKGMIKAENRSKELSKS